MAVDDCRLQWEADRAEETPVGLAWWKAMLEPQVLWSADGLRHPWLRAVHPCCWSDAFLLCEISSIFLLVFQILQTLIVY